MFFDGKLTVSKESFEEHYSCLKGLRNIRIKLRKNLGKCHSAKMETEWPILKFT